MVADNPTDHHIFLSAFAGERELQSTSAGITIATPRGEIQVKGKGAMQVLLVVGNRTAQVPKHPETLSDG